MKLYRDTYTERVEIIGFDTNESLNDLQHKNAIIEEIKRTSENQGLSMDVIESNAYRVFNSAIYRNVLREPIAGSDKETKDALNDDARQKLIDFYADCYGQVWGNEQALPMPAIAIKCKNSGFKSKLAPLKVIERQLSIDRARARLFKFSLFDCQGRAGEVKETIIIRSNINKDIANKRLANKGQFLKSIVGAFIITYSRESDEKLLKEAGIECLDINGLSFNFWTLWQEGIAASPEKLAKQAKIIDDATRVEFLKKSIMNAKSARKYAHGVNNENKIAQADYNIKRFSEELQELTS